MSRKNIYSIRLLSKDETISKTLIMFESTSKTIKGVFHIIVKDYSNENPVVSLAENYIVDAIGSIKMDDFFTGMSKAERIISKVDSVSLEVEEVISESDNTLFCQVVKDSGVFN